MANFYRLVFTALVWAFFGNAYASFPATSVSGFEYQGRTQTNTVGPWLPTYTAVCSNWKATADAAGGSNAPWTVITAIETSCTIKSNNNTYQTWGTTKRATTVYSCPANATLGGSTCTCAAGATESGSTCNIANPSDICVTLNSGDQKITYPVTNTSTSKSSIYKGVTVTGKTIIYGKKDGAVVAGSQVVYGPFTCAVGSTVSADVPAGGDAAVGPASCKTSEYYGTVNGIPTCVSGALSSTNVIQSVAPTPAGAASGPTSGLGPQAPASAVSSGKEVTCEGSTCKTTTTYKDASGATVGTSEDTQDQPSFCEENPALSICKDSRFSSNSCASAPSCDGDAVQCGIAKLAWQTSCALNPTSGAETALYDSSKGLTGNQTQGASGSPVTLGAGSFSTTDLIGGGSSGMADLSITVWNTPVTLPLSNLNQYLAMFGNVLMAVAFIVAVSIVRGR